MNEFMKMIMADRIQELKEQGIEDPIAYLEAEADKARQQSFEREDQNVDPKQSARERIERKLAASDSYKQETIKPTKANLNRALIWSPSRINEWRKSEVVGGTSRPQPKEGRISFHTMWPVFILPLGMALAATLAAAEATGAITRFSCSMGRRIYWMIPGRFAITW